MTDSTFLFNLGWAYEQAGRPTDALPLLRRSLERSQPEDSIVRKLFTLIMDCHHRLGQPAEALAACAQGRGYYPDDAQLLFQEALLWQQQGDRTRAEACLLLLLRTSEGPHFASVAEGLRGFKARHQLALLYQEQGRLAEAEAQWQAALADKPEFMPALLGLAELHLAQQQWQQAEALAERLEQAGAGPPPGPLMATALRARSHMGQKQYPAARRLLEEALARFPEAVLLWVVLSHALLQEGRHGPATEQALRKVLALDPGNTEARNNLTLWLRQQGKAGSSAHAPW